MPSASAPSASIPASASPPSTGQRSPSERISRSASSAPGRSAASSSTSARSEEHTSELQSLAYLVCRLLLEKKNACTATQRKIYHALRSIHPREHAIHNALC